MDTLDERLDIALRGMRYQRTRQPDSIVKGDSIECRWVDGDREVTLIIHRELCDVKVSGRVYSTILVRGMPIDGAVTLTGIFLSSMDKQESDGKQGAGHAS